MMINDEQHELPQYAILRWNLMLQECPQINNPYKHQIIAFLGIRNFCVATNSLNMSLRVCSSMSWSKYPGIKVYPGQTTGSIHIKCSIQFKTVFHIRARNIFNRQVIYTTVWLNRVRILIESTFILKIHVSTQNFK